MNFWRRKPQMLVVPAAAYDAIAQLLEPATDGKIDMSGYALARGAEEQPVDDPIARHNARVLSRG